MFYPVFETGTFLKRAYITSKPKKIHHQWYWKVLNFLTLGHSFNEGWIYNLQFANHERELDDFQYQINRIKEAGFNLIGVSQIYNEDTFIFETQEEALKAYEALELPNESDIQGWWYGKERFLETVENYEKEFKVKVLTYWL